MKTLAIFVGIGTMLFGADTEVLFSTASPDVGPFPSDVFTVTDAAQKTRRRINMPVPGNCSLSPSACSDAALLNTLDGFSVDPVIRLCFSDRIAEGTLASGVFLIGLHRLWQPITVERVFYDPATNCATMNPNVVLDSSRTYALVVTDTVRDSHGRPVRASRAFTDWITNQLGALDFPVATLLKSLKLASGTLFTTMSATDWTSKARDFVNAPTTPSIVQPLGPVEGFPLAGVTSLTWLAETRVSAPLRPFEIPHDLPNVGKVAFGMYFSPNFITTEGPTAGTIPPTPTGLPIKPQTQPVVDPRIPGYVPISFTLWLPSSPKPAAGYPVAIYGHGLTDNRFGAPTAIASTLASKGIATLSMEIVGHGFGSASMMQVGLAGAPAVQLPSPGRGVSITPDGSIGPLDGCILPGAYAARDCARQTAVDIFTLVRAIKTTNGYYNQLDPERIYYLGQSFGGNYGSLVVAYEPSIKAAVLNVTGASAVDTVRLAQDRPLGVFYLGSRTPSLLNLPFGPGHPLDYDFNDNFVLNGRPPLVNTVPGAPQIQQAFEVANWFNMLANPLPYAPILKGKRVFHLFAKGDEEVPNPTNAAFIRAADGRTSSRWLRFDLAKEVAAAQLPPQPHRFLSNPDILSTPAQASIALAAQRQVAEFFASGGTTILDANQFLTAPFIGKQLFELPASLPNDLNFVRRPAAPPQP